MAGMGPGRPAAECGNAELLDELIDCVEGGDYEFRAEYANEIMRRMHIGCPQMSEDASLFGGE